MNKNIVKACCKHFIYRGYFSVVVVVKYPLRKAALINSLIQTKDQGTVCNVEDGEETRAADAF